MSRITWPAVVGAALLGAACAGSPPPALKDARSAYERASKGPAQQLAPDQLHAAQTYLKTAEKTYDDEGDSANVRDRAYVAMRKAQLAEAHAGIIQANLDLERAEAQRLREAQSASVSATSQLEQTRAELASARGEAAQQSQELETEKERREQAEAAQQQAVAALSSIGQVTKEARGTVLTLSGSVIFASGKAELLPSARTKLSEVARALATGNKDSKIVIEGHTDGTGSAELNQALSLQRAQAVRDELVAQGVTTDRLRVEGFGESRPVADNSTPAGRANNRRVELVIQPQS